MNISHAAAQRQAVDYTSYFLVAPLRRRVRDLPFNLTTPQTILIEVQSTLLIPPISQCVIFTKNLRGITIAQWSSRGPSTWTTKILWTTTMAMNKSKANKQT